MQKEDKVRDINPEQLAVSFASLNIGLATMMQLFNDKLVTISIEKIIETNIKIFITGISR